MTRGPRLVRPRDWSYAVRRTGHSFVRVGGFDAAAALTFFAALTLFPAVLTVMSALAVVHRERALDFVLKVVGEVASAEMVDTLRGPLEQFLTLPNPGAAFLAGFALTLWTGSAYTTAFGRAVNMLYGVHEGRRIWKFRTLMLAVTLLLTMGTTVELVLLLGTPPVAAAAAELAGVGEPWVTAWNLARWPVLVLLAAALIALLYFWTPTVDRQTVPWFSSGAILALVGWAAGTAGFWLYVLGFSHYNELYGWVGGALVVLLWLFLSNLVLILGAGLDAELTRVMHLRLGIESEATIRVPMRDTERNLIIARSRARDEAEGRAIREESKLEPVLAAEPPPILPGAAERLRRRLGGMNSRDDGTPDEPAVHNTFSTPADADFTTPGNPIESDEHLDELDEDRATRDHETPGDPLTEK